MSKFISSNIKKTATWLEFMEEGVLAKNYMEYTKKAKNAPNMVKNFVRELKRNEGEYDKFQHDISILIKERKVSQQDLNFVNNTFKFDFRLESEKVPSEPESGPSHVASI